MKEIPKKLRSDPFLKDILALAEYIYEKASEVSNANGDEKWMTESKLRSSSNDVVFYTAQAVSCNAHESAAFEWNSAKKHLFAVQTMYLFAVNQKFIEVDPEIVVKIDDILEKMEKLIEDSNKIIDDRNKKELEPWLEKYRIWQEINKK